MSYISFYRKWRPQAFSEVVGQEHIVKTLQNAISKNRLVHGYMFCGPKGTGKTSVARIFAKAINCVNGPAVEPCNKCVNCISITAGSNIDIVEIDGASNNGIDNIRDLREKIKFLPVFLKKKIYIIDEAHQITSAAFNALLKTLEEPPEHVIFIMATTDPNKVIKTIMSRCQRFDFEPISLEGLRQRLKDIASSENIDITDSALSIVAKYSDGSLRDAEGILEQLSSFSDSRITVDDVSSILGIIDQDMLFELANIILEKNISQGLLFVRRLFSTSFSLNAFISEFLEHLYSLYVIKNYENPAEILDMPDDFKENYYNQAGLFTPLQLENLIDLFTGLLAQIKDSENPKTFFKAAVIKALNTEAIKSGPAISRSHVIKNDQATKSDLVTKTDHAIKNGQVTKILKIIDLDMRQSNNEPTEVNSGSKSNAEATVSNNSSIETVATAGIVSTTEIPGQKKMPSAESVPGRETNKNAPNRMNADNIAQWETADNDLDRKSTETKLDKTAVKNSADTVLDKAVDEEAAETAPNKAVTVKAVDKKESVELKEDIPESLLQDSKKAVGSFSQLIPEIWENVLVKIKAKSVPLQAVLKEVRRFNIQGNKIIFSLEPKNRWHKTELNKPENRALIQELLKSLTGEKFEITFDFISDENITESIDITHSAKKIRTTGGLPSGNKDIPGSGAKSVNSGNPEFEAGKDTAALNKTPDGKYAIEGTDAYGYFEEKFKVKEK